MKKSPEAPKASAATARNSLRKKRMEKISRASTVSFTMEAPVSKFMAAKAKDAGMNLNHYMQMLVETHVIAEAPESDPLAQRLSAKRFVINHAVDLATQMDAQGEFDDHFILNVVQKASVNEVFAAQYELALGGKEAEGTRPAERARISLNQQIGRLIKKAVGARSKRNDNGKIARAQVQGALVSTYTLLEKAA